MDENKNIQIARVKGLMKDLVKARDAESKILDEIWNIIKCRLTT